MEIKMARSRKEGVVLIIALMVMSVLLVLTGVYFTAMLTEKRSADAEKRVVQALAFGEAGAEQAKAELRKRIRSSLNTRVMNVTLASTIQAYVNSTNSLGFLAAYAYVGSETPFNVSGTTASLPVSSLNISSNSTVQGGAYSATIYLEANGNPAGNMTTEVFTFPFKYWINATGNVTQSLGGASRSLRLAQGIFNVTVQRASFSRYALFTFHHRTQSNTTVWFTGSTNFTGPVHTNERFCFSNNLSAHFTEDVSQVYTNATFANNGHSILLNASSNPPWDVPVFDKSFNRGVANITMNLTVTQNDVKAQALGTLSEPSTNGTYIPNNGTSVTGGIYIRGNCVIVSSVGSGDSAVYNITRGSTTKTIVVDYAANQTRITTSGNNTTETYAGLPDGIDDEGVIIYSRDNITSFNGTVQHSSAVTITTERNVVISNNVLYEQYNAGPPVNATGYSNVLSLLSWGGNVSIGTTAPNNVSIHGVIMAPAGVFKVDSHDVGAPRGIATLLGGVITDYYGAFGQFSGANMTHGYGRNFVYDARMLSGMAPPYFPYLNRFQAQVGQDANGTEDLNRELIWQDRGD